MHGSTRKMLTCLGALWTYLNDPGRGSCTPQKLWGSKGGASHLQSDTCVPQVVFWSLGETVGFSSQMQEYLGVCDMQEMLACPCEIFECSWEELVTQRHVVAASREVLRCHLRCLGAMGKCLHTPRSSLGPPGRCLDSPGRCLCT